MFHWVGIHCPPTNATLFRVPTQHCRHRPSASSREGGLRLIYLPGQNTMQAIIYPIFNQNPRQPWSLAAVLAGCAPRWIWLMPGLKVYLVEHTPCLGGRVAQLGLHVPPA